MTDESDRYAASVYSWTHYPTRLPWRRRQRRCGVVCMAVLNPPLAGWREIWADPCPQMEGQTALKVARCRPPPPSFDSAPSRSRPQRRLSDAFIHVQQCSWLQKLPEDLPAQAKRRTGPEGRELLAGDQRILCKRLASG